MSIEQSTQRTVTAFEFQDFGVDHAQYFPGVGTAFTDWDDVFVGVGDTAREAAENALESLYQSIDSVEPVPARDMDAEALDFDNTVDAHDLCTGKNGHTEDCLADTSLGVGDDCRCHDECELQHYVALYVRYADEVTS